MYRFLLRSCKLIGGLSFTLASRVVRTIAISGVPWLHGHYSASLLLLTPPTPSRLPPFSRYFRLYGFLLHPFLDGTRRVSPVAWCVLVIVLLLKPRQSETSRQSVGLRCSMLPSPNRCELGFWGLVVSRPCLHSLSLRPDDSLAILQMALSTGFRNSVSLLPAVQATRTPTLTLVGFSH
jgi:hypothetical protein